MECPYCGEAMPCACPGRPKIVKTPYGTLRLEPMTKEARDWAIKAIQEKDNENETDIQD